MKKVKENKFLKMSREQFDKYMCKTYPKIFRQRNLPMNQTCMCWGFDIGPGWYELLDQMCKKLQLLDDLLGIETIATQVKEKFGGLRFYNNISSANYQSFILTEKQREEVIYTLWEIINDITSRAEEQSYNICEQCGDYGSPNDGGWIVTLCEKCRAKREKKAYNKPRKYRRDKLGRFKRRKT
jgi:hypothetical protein